MRATMWRRRRRLMEDGCARHISDRVEGSQFRSTTVQSRPASSFRTHVSVADDDTDADYMVLMMLMMLDVDVSKAGGTTRSEGRMSRDGHHGRNGFSRAKFPSAGEAVITHCVTGLWWC
jgi:hypothetical protein